MQPVKVRPGELSEHLGSYPGDEKGDALVEAPGKGAHKRWVCEWAGRNASEA